MVKVCTVKVLANALVIECGASALDKGCECSHGSRRVVVRQMKKVTDCQPPRKVS